MKNNMNMIITYCFVKALRHPGKNIKKNKKCEVLLNKKSQK